MKYNAIIFDLDHTLLDTEQNSRDAMEEVYRYHSFDKYYETFDEFYNVYSAHNQKMWNAYEKNLATKEDILNLRFYTPFRHIDSLTPEKSFELNNEYLDRVVLKTKVIDGAFDLLNDLKPYFPMHILSNGFNEVQHKKMDSAGLTPYFDNIILSDHIGINKPDPAFFNYALRIIGMKPDEVVMVGDNWNSDIIGAKASKIDQVWYNPSQIAPKEFIPTYTVGKLSEVRDILM